jgi:hypothetical protein
MAWPGNGWRPQHGERSALGNDLFYRPDPCTIRTKQITVYGYVTLAGDWLECGVLLARVWRTPSELCSSIRRSSTRRPRGLTLGYVVRTPRERVANWSYL